MKPALLAVALMAGPLLVPAAAQAQVAAGAVPNTFDRPAQAAPAQPAAPPVATAPANAQSEDTLRTVIANAQAGRVDYALMTDTLGAEVRRQEATIVPIIQSFGSVVAVDFLTSREGGDIFIITFANALTEWRIGFDDAGKIDALLFRPAPTSGVAAAPVPAASPAQ